MNIRKFHSKNRRKISVKKGGAEWKKDQQGKWVDPDKKQSSKIDYQSKPVSPATNLKWRPSEVKGHWKFEDELSKKGPDNNNNDHKSQDDCVKIEEIPCKYLNKMRQRVSVCEKDQTGGKRKSKTKKKSITKKKLLKTNKLFKN